MNSNARSHHSDDIENINSGNSNQQMQNILQSASSDRPSQQGKSATEPNVTLNTSQRPNIKGAGKRKSTKQPSQLHTRQRTESQGAKGDAKKGSLSQCKTMQNILKPMSNCVIGVRDCTVCPSKPLDKKRNPNTVPAAARNNITANAIPNVSSNSTVSPQNELVANMKRIYDVMDRQFSTASGAANVPSGVQNSTLYSLWSHPAPIVLSQLFNFASGSIINPVAPNITLDAGNINNNSKAGGVWQSRSQACPVNNVIQQRSVVTSATSTSAFMPSPSYTLTRNDSSNVAMSAAGSRWSSMPIPCNSNMPTMHSVVTPQQNIKEWHQHLSLDERTRVIQKFVSAVSPSYPSNTDNRLMQFIITYSQAIEFKAFKDANSKADYYQLLAKKYCRVLRDLEIQHQRQKAIQETQIRQSQTELEQMETTFEQMEAQLRQERQQLQHNRTDFQRQQVQFLSQQSRLRQLQTLFMELHQQEIRSLFHR